MAKKNVGRLAGLAALAGAAYMASKGKDKDDDAGDQKTSSYTGDTKKVEALDKTNESSYMPRSTMMAMEDVGSATNDPVAKRGIAAAKDSAKAISKPTPKPVAKGKGRLDPGGSSPALAAMEARKRSRLDPGGSSPALAAMEARKARRDEEARVANINAYRGDLLGQKKEYEILTNMQDAPPPGMMKKGGAVKKMASGGMTASRRADGIASRGKTRCKMY